MPTILCVDDQLEALTIRKLLLETKGYTVSTASSGDNGLDALANGDFDAVILDYSMPDRDGEEIAREIKSRWPNLPVIMLSGYPEVPPSAMDVADAFIVKGSSPNDLLETLENLTGQKPAPRTSMTVERSREIMTRSKELLASLDRNRKPHRVK